VFISFCDCTDNDTIKIVRCKSASNIVAGTAACGCMFNSIRRIGRFLEQPCIDPHMYFTNEKESAKSVGSTSHLDGIPTAVRRFLVILTCVSAFFKLLSNSGKSILKGSCYY
jgi:hypothetical protein